MTESGDLQPKIISEKIVYDGEIKVVDAEVDFGDGKIYTIEYRRLYDIVSVVAIGKNGTVYLCREWRPAYKNYILQIPAGKCYDTTEEGRIKQAHNELREEIGMDAKNLEKLYEGQLNPAIRCTVIIYLARNLFESKKDPDDGEIIEVVKIPFEKALEIFKNGSEKTPSFSLLGLMLAKDKLGS